ncbi:hypothetical protein KKD52_18120 [Myxococcota bacterium]|nr:hypothetical protein [Myxococcota bacterium]MBU1412031.1 hypothetical protein [Myxococcota bacterium]MBU1512271.1 hypothetical protein [Myxococcota bacterium]
MKKLLPVFILALGPLWACTPAPEKTTSGPEGEPSAKAAPVNPTEPEAKTGTTELRIKASELRVEGTIVWFEPDTRVMRSSYTRYAFDLPEFEKIIGSARPEQDVTAIIRITKTEQKTNSPADPNAPSPDGGFHITIHHAKILSVKQPEGETP